jgi:hypothetical protein
MIEITSQIGFNPMGAYHMSETRSQQAAELLSLEKRYREGQLRPEERKRWFDLAAMMFMEKEETGARKNFRLPCECKARVRVGKSIFDCLVTNLSHSGLAVIGELRQAAKGDAVVVDMIDVSGKAIWLDLHCEVVDSRARGGKAPLTGLVIGPENPPGIRTLYYEKAYYPAYLDYLEPLAGAKG